MTEGGLGLTELKDCAVMLLIAAPADENVEDILDLLIRKLAFATADENGRHLI